MSHSSFKVIACALLAAAFLAGGCAQPSHEERVVEARSKYQVTLNGVLPQQPVVEPDPLMSDEMTDETAAGEEGETDAAGAVDEGAAADAGAGEEGEALGDEGLAMEPLEPLPTTVLFDVLVRYDDRDPLPGVTLDVTHADPFEAEKGVYRQWIDTAGMTRGEERQISFELEIPDFEEGDKFSAEVRSNVPPEERSEYREFTEGAS